MNIKIELIANESKRIYRFGEVTEITVGREDDNILSPIVESISRHHAKIFFKDGSWFVQDLDSTNGSFRNEVKLGTESVKISSGDKLRFGKVETVVIFENASEGEVPVTETATPAVAEEAKVSPLEVKPLSAKPADVKPLEDIPELSAEEMSPVPELKPVAAEPPAPSSPLSPISPVKPGLRPGLKLPPKPGLGGGLKFPPRPGSAISGGLKLPPKPSVLKPGLKLPPKAGPAGVVPGVGNPAK